MKKLISIILATVFFFTLAASPVSACVQDGGVSRSDGPVSDVVYGESKFAEIGDFKTLPASEIESDGIVEDDVFGKGTPYNEYFYLSSSQYSTLKSVIDSAYAKHTVKVNLYSYRIPYVKHNANLEDTFDLINDLTFDNPKCFDLVTYEVWYRGNYIDRIEFKYNLSLSTYKSRLSACDKIANEMVSDLKSSRLPVEFKMLILHDRLAEWNEYDHESLKTNRKSYSDCQTMYGAFVLKTSVCEGYAMAYSYMLDKLGVSNYLCESSDLDHIWNIVELNFSDLGRCSFHIDVTWDDIHDTKGGVKHDYFLKSTAAFKHDAYDYDRSPNNTHYDSGFFWDYTSSAVQYVNGDIWFVTEGEEDIKYGEKLCVLDVDTNKQYWHVDLEDDGGFKWPYYQSGYVYSVNFTKLETDGTYLYFNSADKIYKYNISSGNYTVLYDFDFGNNAIRGFEIDDNKLTISVFNKEGKFVKDYIYRAKNGEISTQTGLSKFGGNLYYLKKGLVDTSFTGFAKYGSSKYYVVKGVKSTKTGLAQSSKDGQWYYIENGKLNTKTTGFIKHAGNKYYVVKGVKSTKTGLAQSSNGQWYYIVSGKLNTKTTGFIKHAGNKYYVVKGVKSTKTGLVQSSKDGKWYYVVNGKLNTKTTGFIKHAGNKYYVVNGVKSTKTTIVKSGSSKYYIKNGKLQSSFSGKVKISGKTYKISKGKVV